MKMKFAQKKNVKVLNDSVKKVLFLFALFSFVSLMVFISQSFRNTGKTNFSYNAQSQLDIPISGFKIDEFEVEEVDQEELVANGEVLGAGTAGCESVGPQGCISKVLKSQPICTEIDVNFNLASGNAVQNGEEVFIQKNSVVEIWSATSPLPIFYGSEIIYNSTYEITKDQSIFRSAGHLIDENLVGGQYWVPGEENERGVEIFREAEKEEFAVNAGVTGAEASEALTLRRVEALKSKDAELQPSIFNPEGTNLLASFNMIGSFGVPGIAFDGRQYDNKDNPNCLDIGSISVTSFDEADSFKMCSDSRQPYNFIDRTTLLYTQYVECTTNDPSQCEKTQLVGIMIDAVYGSNQICEADQCADQYFDNRVSTTLTPDEAAELTENLDSGDYFPALRGYYVTTPCTVRVDYKDLYDIPCLWDISPYKAVYDLEAAQVAPGSEDFPETWDLYWSNVMMEARRRASEVSASCGV